MLQDIQFANDVKVLIQEKQKQSAFVYVRNHLTLIEEALNQGAKIADIHNLLQKNGISLTLPTLRLYLHRLRNSNNKKANPKTLPVNNSNIQNSTPAPSTNLTPMPINPNMHLIKQQNPDLEELSKAFMQRKI